eukprot:gene19648-3189_t
MTGTPPRVKTSTSAPAQPASQPPPHHHTTTTTEHTEHTGRAE